MKNSFFISDDFIRYTLSQNLCEKNVVKEGDFESEIRSNGFGYLLDGQIKKKMRRIWKDEEWEIF